MKKPFAILFSFSIFVATFSIATRTSALPLWGGILREVGTGSIHALEAEGPQTYGNINLLAAIALPGTKWEGGTEYNPVKSGKINLTPYSSCQAGCSVGVRLVFYVPDNLFVKNSPETFIDQRMYRLLKESGIDFDEPGNHVPYGRPDLRGTLGFDLQLSGFLTGFICARLVADEVTSGKSCVEVKQEASNEWDFYPFQDLPVGEYLSAAGVVELILEFESGSLPISAAGPLPLGKATLAIKSITLGPSG